MLQLGQSAPNFTLPDADMEAVSLAAFKGRKNVVLLFYPRDGSPGGVMETADFSDHDEQFVKHDCVILGISQDDCLTHAAFRDKHGLSIGLLSDPEGEVCRSYGVLQDRATENGRRAAVVRSTFVIDKKGVIRHAAYNVNPKHHALEIIDVVKKLRA
jgi:peroxiredoxin Q/BCP